MYFLKQAQQSKAQSQQKNKPLFSTKSTSLANQLTLKKTIKVDKILELSSTRPAARSQFKIQTRITKPEEVYPICVFKPRVRKRKSIIGTDKNSKYQSTLQVLHDALQNQENYDSSTIDQIKKTERVFLMH